MPDRYALSVNTDWFDTANWSASDGGAAGASVPTDADDVYLTANSGNITLTGNVGTVSNTGGDYSASCCGVLSINTTGYTALFDLDTFDLVIGSGGLTLAAGTMNGGTAGTVIVCRGDINGTGGTWNDETSTLVIDGGTVGTPLVITAFDPYKFVLSEGSYLAPVGALSIASTASIYGSLVMAINQSMTMASNVGLTVYTNGSIATSGTGIINGFIGDVTIADGTSVTGILEMRNTILTVTSGVLAATLQPRNQTAGTLTITAGSKLSDINCSFTAANALAVSFSGSNEIHGDITESGSTGTMSMLGLPVLAGLLDQDIDVPQLDVSGLTYGIDKAAGTVTLENGDFVLGEDAGTVVASVASGDLITNGDFALGDTGWYIADESTISVGSARIYTSDGTFSGIYQDVLTIGKTYRVRIVVDSVTTGSIRFLPGSSASSDQALSVGSNDFTITADGVNGRAYISRVSGATDAQISSVIVEELPGGYGASTQACDGIIVPVDNTDEIDLNGFDLVLGSDGLDASAASGVTISMGSGDVVSRGDFLVHASATLDDGTSTLVFDGGTVGTPLELDAAGSFVACTISVGSYVNYAQANNITTLIVYGDVTQDAALTIVDGTYYSGSSTSGVEAITSSGTLTIEDADTFVRPVTMLSGSTLDTTTGTLDSSLTVANGYNTPPGGTTTLDGVRMTDLVFSYDNESPVFPIQMDAGLMDFSITNASNPFWIFPDGTTSTADRPAKTLASAGTVYLFCDDFTKSDIQINDNETNAEYLGDLSDLPALTYYLDLYNCSLVTGSLADLPALTYYLRLHNCTNVTGSLADLPALTYYLRLTNCTNVTGSLADLPALTYYLRLDNCTNVTGDLADLPALTYYLSLTACTNVTGSLADLPALTYSLRLTNCSLVTGILPATVTATNIYLNSTGLSKTDLEQSIINIESNGSSNGTFEADTGMPTIDNATAIAAVASLRGRGWTVTLAGGV